MTAFAIPDSVQDRALPLLAIGRFDTVVRELGAILETRRRESINADSRHYRLSLVTAYAARVSASGHVPNAYGRFVAGVFRTTMAFVRNEFAHQVADIPRPRGLALVAHVPRRRNHRSSGSPRVIPVHAAAPRRWPRLG